MNDKKQTSLSMITCIAAFFINAGINFFLTPYIISKLGNEAYGFIGLSSEFVNYASVLTFALNSMSSRFIAVEYHRGNKEKAQSYLNSVLVANMILAGIILFVAIFVVWKLEYLIKIPAYLMADVKITFSVVFIDYMLSIIVSVFNAGAFVKNRMDKVYIRNMLSYFIKLAATIALITLFSVKIYFIALTALICTAFVGVVNYSLTLKLLPDLKIGIRGFKISSIKEIMASGVWMSLLSVSNLLLTGLNLLMTNLFVGTEATGLLSAAKCIPSYITNLSQQMAQIFSPKFTKLYAENKIDELIVEANKATKIMAIIITVPIAGFMAFGLDFYSLWLKTYSVSEIKTIQIISIMITIPWLLNSYVYPLIQINTAMNKIKWPTIMTFVTGLLNILVVLPFGLSHNLTLYVLTGIGSVAMSLRLIFYVPIYTAKTLNKKWYCFYPAFIRCIAVFGIDYVLLYFGKNLFMFNNWLQLIFAAIVCGGITMIISFMLLFNNEEKKEYISILKQKFLKKG